MFAQYVFPQIGGAYASGIGWISCAAIDTFVERQKPRRFSAQLGTHHYQVVVNGKVNGTAFLHQQECRCIFLGVAVVLILLDGVFYGLVCIMVL